MRDLRCGVDNLRISVIEFVDFHHGHLGPVRVINVVFEQREAKGMRDERSSMNHRFTERRGKENKR